MFSDDWSERKVSIWDMDTLWWTESEDAAIWKKKWKDFCHWIGDAESCVQKLQDRVVNAETDPGYIKFIATKQKSGAEA